MRKVYYKPTVIIKRFEMERQVALCGSSIEEIVTVWMNNDIEKLKKDNQDRAK